MAKKKTSWDELTMQQRSEYLKLGLRFGISVDDIKQLYNSYKDGGHLGHWKDGTWQGESQNLNSSWMPQFADTPSTSQQQIQNGLGIKPMTAQEQYTAQEVAKDIDNPGYTQMKQNAQNAQMLKDKHIVEQNPGLTTMGETPLVQTAMSFVPVLGDAMQAAEAFNAAKQGDYLTAGLIGAQAVLPNMVEKPLKKVPFLASMFGKTTTNIMNLGGNLKSTGGPLYPFSFEKNPYFKTPVVRYDEGGHLFSFGDWLQNVFNSNDATTTVNTGPAPLDLGELAARQAYAESRFDSNAISPAKAVGLFQVTPNTLAYYNSKTGNNFTTQDLYDDAINQQVRDWYMDDLMNRSWNTKNNPSDSVQYAKSLGAYNWGPTNLVNTLNKAKADGVDIYNSWDWLAYLPTETRDYINFVLRNQDNSAHRNNTMYNKAADEYDSKVNAIKSNKQ